MRFYRIPGQDRPFFLSEEHAALIDATPVETDRPAKNASATVWRAYAVLKGMDSDVAEAMSRTDLIDTYAPEE